MKNYKIYGLWICISFCIVFFILSRIAGNVDDGKPSPIAYPDSELSDDLFVSQNIDYVENESLTETYGFMDVPFVIDLHDGKTADIEEGHLVYTDEGITFFSTQVEKGENIHDAILEQYPAAVNMHYSKKASYIQTAMTDTGYINGFYATYFIDHLLVSTGVQIDAKNAYVVGYIIDPGVEYDYYIVLSFATTIESSEALSICKELLDLVTVTLRYDDDLDREQIRKREDALEEALRAAKNEDNNVVSYSGYENNIADSRNVEVIVPNDFRNMACLITWTNACSDYEISFFNEFNTRMGKVSTKGTTQALIEVGEVKKGIYYLECSHYGSCGDINIKLIEN